MINEISHYELCKLTAERFIKNNKIVIYEYQTTIGNEYPDVLCFDSYTTLYEIKVNYQDFKKDNEKECRIKYRIKYFPQFSIDMEKNTVKGILWREYGMGEFIQLNPHLGRFRYYVCPENLIKPDEIKNGFGLYWYKNKKFYKKLESKKFRNNVHHELELLSHAFRKYACEKKSNILINKYK